MVRGGNRQRRGRVTVRSIGRRNRNRLGRFIDEYFTFSIKSGSTQVINWGSITTVPKNVNARPVFLSVQAFAGFDPAPINDSLPGYLVPAAISCQLFSPELTICATSPPMVTSTAASRLRVGYPRSADWFSYSSIAAKKAVAQIEAICLGPSGTSVDHYIRGVAHLRYRISNEVLTPTCPTVLRPDGSRVESMTVDAHSNAQCDANSVLNSDSTPSTPILREFSLVSLSEPNAPID